LTVTSVVIFSLLNMQPEVMLVPENFDT